MPNKSQKSIIQSDPQFLNLLCKCLLKYGSVKIDDFGIFKLIRTKGIKNGMNPFTQKRMNTPPFTKIKFRPTVKLKNKIQKWHR